MRNFWRATPWILLLWVLTGQAEEIRLDSIDPELTFGYSIGDTLERRIHLPSSIAPTSLIELPEPQRYGRWIALQQVTLTEDSAWLVLRFQIINAPSSVISTALPAISLADTQNNTLNVEQWSFSLAPLIPPEGTDAVTMQSDHPVPAIDLATLRFRLHWLVICLLATLFGWLIWWLWQNRIDRVRLPFARAHHLLNKPRTGSLPTDTAWLLMHEAFDQAGGRAVSTGSIVKLLKRAPWLKPYEAQIRMFFAASESRFFAQSADSDTLDLHDLCKQLHNAEKNSASINPSSAIATSSAR